MFGMKGLREAYKYLCFFGERIEKEWDEEQRK